MYSPLLPFTPAPQAGVKGECHTCLRMVSHMESAKVSTTAKFGWSHTSNGSAQDYKESTIQFLLTPKGEYNGTIISNYGWSNTSKGTQGEYSGSPTSNCGWSHISRGLQTLDNTPLWTVSYVGGAKVSPPANYGWSHTSTSSPREYRESTIA